MGLALVCGSTDSIPSATQFRSGGKRTMHDQLRQNQRMSSTNASSSNPFASSFTSIPPE